MRLFAMSVCFFGLLTTKAFVGGGWNSVTLLSIEETEHSVVITVIDRHDASLWPIASLATEYDASNCKEYKFVLRHKRYGTIQGIVLGDAISEFIQPYRQQLRNLVTTRAEVHMSFIADVGPLYQTSACSFSSVLSDDTFEYLHHTPPNVLLGL